MQNFELGTHRFFICCRIGFAIAERLAADGASVVVSSRKENNVSSAVEKLRSCGYSVSGVVCHVSKASDRERLIKEAQDKFGGIDILVSNAAVNPAVGPVLEVMFLFVLRKYPVEISHLVHLKHKYPV
jgi:NAD(P)-dependent dehydrogenase (short-subunit alcohol dehydrogenase family)